MKVYELVELLSELDPNAEVILSSDAEGNGFSSLDGWGEAYLPPDWESGRVEEIFDEEDLELEQDETFENNDESIDDYTKVIVLWPM